LDINISHQKRIKPRRKALKETSNQSPEQDRFVV
jgi:hypothetical protein